MRRDPAANPHVGPPICGSSATGACSRTTRFASAGGGSALGLGEPGNRRVAERGVDPRLAPPVQRGGDIGFEVPGEGEEGARAIHPVLTCPAGAIKHIGQF